MKMKKMIPALVASALAICMMIGSTLAYLTADEKVTNSFTIGNVSIDLKEPGFSAFAKEGKVENVVPNQTIPKDPTVENNGANKAVVFLEVSIPKMTMNLVAEDGTKSAESALLPIYTFQASGESGTLTTVNNNNTVHSGWMLVSSKLDAADKNTYLFGWNQALAGGAATATLFDTVKVANFTSENAKAWAEGRANRNADIQVNAYAIQAENIGNGIDTTGMMDAEKLGAIYDVYLKQDAVGTAGTQNGTQTQP